MVLLRLSTEPGEISALGPITKLIVKNNTLLIALPSYLDLFLLE